MRGRSNTHLIRKDFGETHADAVHEYRFDFWCGDRGNAFMWSKPTTDEGIHSCCRKCNAAFFQSKLDAKPNGFRITGKNLTAEEKEALGKRWQWRHMWPVGDGEGREWGWIAMEGGWGERWQFVTWSPYASGDSETLTGQIGGPISNGRGDAKTFGSKEAVLFKLPALIAEHHLRDKATRIAETAASRAQARVEAAQREIDRAEHERLRGIRQAEQDAQRAAELAGLQSILETFGPALSNLERVGLMAAIERWAK